MRIRSAIATTLLVLLGGCGDDGITDPNPPTIQLSAAQASLLVAQAEELSEVHTELEWLADSIELVLHAGATAKRIIVTSDGEAHVYYAVSVQRESVMPPTAFSTWHLFAFDNASSPGAFIIANGFASGTGTTAPTSVNAGFGGQSVFAHFVSLDGGVIDYRATMGGATFARESTGAACPMVGGPPPTGVSCVLAEMEVSLEIVTTTAPGGQAPRSGFLQATVVPGVLVTVGG